jgi:glutathione S-transferase
MKLYFAPGACSFAPHIAAHELGIPVQPIKVDLRSHTLADGSSYYAVNPKGYVPLLELDDGTRLTEVGVILQYLADRKPGTLAPGFGGLERYRTMEWLNFVATEIHKGFSPLWYPDTPELTRERAIAALHKRVAIVEEALGKQRYIASDAFGIVDAYLYTVLSWAKFLKVDLAAFPRVVDYLERIGERPAVRAAKTAEATTRAAQSAAVAPKPVSA